MDAAGHGRSSVAKRPKASRLRTALVRTAAWIVAVPAVCAAVIVGGAVPLYLLLPDAKPSASETAPAPKPVATAGAKPAGAPAKVAAAVPPAKPVGEAAAPPDEPPAETAEDAPATDEPAAGPAEDAPEPKVATVVPTPRPEPPPRPNEARPGDDKPSEVAALGTPPVPQPEKPLPEPAASAARGRAVILRTVTLRAGPWGRELGTLRQGTPVAVGRCDEWCEVQAGGTSGWVHASFLADALPARRGGVVATARPVERREPVRNRDADWLDDGLAYERDERPAARRPPQWAYDDERPPPGRRYAPPPRYEDDYDPYY